MSATLIARLPPAIDAPGRAEALAALCVRYGVEWLAVFGSATSEAFDPARSDVDFLIKFRPNAPHRGWADLDLQHDLEALFGREVDLVAPRALENPYFRENALETLRPVYGVVPL